MLRVTWIEEPGGLGQVEPVVTGSRTRAKFLLARWAQLVPNPPIPDYGNAADLTGPWSDRDFTMLNAFVDYWTSISGQPATFKQAQMDSPSKSEVDALEAWAKTYVAPAQFPPSPAIQNCVDNCVATSGAKVGDSNYVIVVTGCVDKCKPKQPTEAAPAPAPKSSSNAGLVIAAVVIGAIALAALSGSRLA